ncbi:MAG: hypothetical protein MK135_08405 [Polyangiaceae bacterium]|nr:hypothetical protein [Polyangiaceae bacterium]
MSIQPSHWLLLFLMICSCHPEPASVNGVQEQPVENQASQSGTSLAKSSPSQRASLEVDKAKSEFLGQNHVRQKTKGSALSAVEKSAATLTLKARHPSGVPYHEKKLTRRLAGRWEDGTVVRVLETAAKGHWLKVEVVERPRQKGWIIADYIREPLAAPSAGLVKQAVDAKSFLPVAGLSPQHPFSSPQACKKALENWSPRRKVTSDSLGQSPLVASWNIRWFPDGRPGKSPTASGGTDPRWLACLLTLFDTPVIALQEIKNSARARQIMDQVIASAKALRPADWQIRFDDCPRPLVQHVALLWDADRVQASEFKTIAEINPNGAPCKNSLRPGLAGTFRYSKNFALRVMSVHLKSGRDARSYGLRRRSLEAAKLWLLDSRQTREGGAKRPFAVVAGDLNTMGCSRCSPPVSALRERQDISAFFSQVSEAAPLSAQLLPQPISSSCSHYYRDEATLLDGYLSEKPPGIRWKVTAGGLCEALACRPSAVSRSAAMLSLSDHCPVFLGTE